MSASNAARKAINGWGAAPAAGVEYPRRKGRLHIRCLRPVNKENQPQKLSQVETPPEERTPLALAEFNRVLGGGLVSGSLVLIGGDPGIGKSTLLLQACACLARDNGDVVYVSGEETPRQTKLRATRLGIDSDHLYVLSETDLESILGHIETMNPCLV
jgi:DNA repair protein RadA/Sms